MLPQVTPTNVNLDDLEDLISCLSAEELEELAECDPDDSSMPPSMRWGAVITHTNKLSSVQSKCLLGVLTAARRRRLSGLVTPTGTD